jgi:16S rRNA (guanine966-N2)-methyltransferase
MKPGLVRIIAGKFRGRRLKVADVKDLRPTPDRVRETLFNWLGPQIIDARCLDLFAGTGVLGFEAVSRGASYVELVDHSMVVVDALRAAAEMLSIENVRIIKAKVPDQLKVPEQPFNIVFLDPPYTLELLFPTCFFLEEQNFLANNAHIYLEARQLIKDNELPSGWRVIKSGQAGQVYYHLVAREND